MNRVMWNGFDAVRARYREAVKTLERRLPGLRKVQQLLVNQRPGPVYTVDTPLVYNGALDDIEPRDRIKLILVADNPGRREQAAENRRYLVGPSGKIADRFFKDTPELGIDFRNNVIILNKTPVHTPRTADLRELAQLGGAEVLEAIDESQKTMARLIAEFHRALSPIPVWIIGYSEMRKGGIFEPFTETLRELYHPQEPAANGKNPVRKGMEARLFLYRHFSMNQFTIDLRQKAAVGETAAETLARIGTAYRERILGW